MQMPGRSYNSDEYRYGFNGMEKDDEVKGSGNSYTTEFRQLDPRIGRWLSVDPVVKEWESPYASFLNNPIYYTDPHGDDPPERTKTHTIKEGDTFYDLAKNSGGEYTVEDLKKWNQGVDPRNLQIDQTINVSDPKRWSSNDPNFKTWSDSENPDELWVQNNGEWLDIGSITFGEWFEGLKQAGVGYESPDGEITTGIYSSAGVAMMEITPEMINWAFMAYGNGNKLNGNKSFKQPQGRYKPQLRLQYESEVYALENTAKTMLNNNMSEEAVARQLVAMRRNLGIKYKNMTPAEKLNQIYNRNMNKYGDKYGPTADYLHNVKGYSWKTIINKASKPGGEDLLFGIKF